MLVATKKNLLRAINDVGNAIFPNCIAPIEKAVEITCAAGVGTLYAFSSNNGISIRKEFEISTGDDMCVAVDYAKFREVCNSALSDTISLAVNGQRLSIQSGMQARLALLDESLMSRADERREFILDMNTDDLKAAFSAVMFMTGSNDGASIGGGVLLYDHILATNGGYANGRVSIPKDFGTPHWIPASNANRIAKVVSGNVSIYSTEHGFKFVSPGTEVDTVFINLAISDYNKLFFADGDIARVSRESLVSLLNAANVFSRDFNNYVNIALEFGTMTVTVGDAFSASIGVEQLNDVTPFGVNGDMVEDIAKRFPQGAEITISIQGNRLLKFSNWRFEYVLALMARR
jgi:DNA polymerase III sliding clamp (beta) subunit (PCNA family)